MANENYEAILKLLLEAAQATAPVQEPAGIPVGVSNRHLHLSQADQDVLFGAGYQMTPIKDLSQPGQFACKEMVTICGPKGAIEKVKQDGFIGAFTGGTAAADALDEAAITITDVQCKSKTNWTAYTITATPQTNGSLEISYSQTGGSGTEFADAMK